MRDPVFVGFLVSQIAVAGLIFYFIILPKLQNVRSIVVPDAKAALQSDALSFWDKIKLRFVAFKTAVTGFLGTLFLAGPELLSQAKLVDLSGTALAKYSSFIGIGIIVLMAWFNAHGQQTAANATPADPG